MSDWFVTDDDSLQCCRPVPADNPEYFEFTQINSYPGHVDGAPFYQVSHGSIYLNDYSPEEIESALAFYGYSGIDDFIEQNTNADDLIYKEDGSLDRENSPGYNINNHLIAEMFFESENQEYVMDEFKTWNDAVNCVSGLTGLDLSSHYDKDLLLLRESVDGVNIDSISTSAEFFGGGKYDPSKNSCSVLKVSVHEPVIATKQISQFLNASSQDSYDISPGAMISLANLLKPVLEANIGHDVHAHPMVAIKWGFEHMDFVMDLDDVFSKLGIINVERYRSSVTQGEAAVFCNGKKIVQYGDDIKLLSDGARDIFSFYYTSGPQYGDVIGGWGSVKPDEQFRRAALTQYGKDIYRAMQPDKSLDKMIQSAGKKVLSAGFDEKTSREVSR